MRALLTGLALCVIGIPARAQCLDWSTAFGPTGAGFPNGPVLAMTVFDDGSGPALYAAIGTSLSVVRWTGTGWTAVGGPFQYGINALLAFDDGSGPRLYAAGSFNIAGGVPALRIARWDGTAWSEVGGGADSQVDAMCVFDDGGGPALYVAGTFLNVGGVAANRIARWDGANWSPLGTGLNESVHALAVHDDGTGPALYAGGNFSLAGGTTAARIARWNGSSWSAVGLGLGGGIQPQLRALLSVGSTLYAGGRFELPGGVGETGVVRWNGSVWANVGTMDGASGAGTWVRSLALHDDGTGSALYAGGGFEVASGNPLVQRIARWDGALWQPLGAGVCCGPQPNVCALQSWNDGSGAKLFAGGYFTIAGGQPSSNVGAWGVPCTTPVITQQPADTTATFPNPVILSILASGTAQLSYQWRKSGNPLVDGGDVHGSLSATLTLDPWNFGDAGSYDCVVSNFLGSATSNSAVVTVPAGGLSGHPVPVTQIITYPIPVPNSPGDTYTGLIQAAQSSTNEVVVGAYLNGSCADCGETCLSLWQGTTLALLYRWWQQVPGLPAGVLFGFDASGGAGIGQREVFAGQGGSCVAWSPLIGAGVNNGNDHMIYYRDASVELPIVRESDPAPGMPAGATFPTVDGFTAWSDNARLALFAQAYQGATWVGNGFWYWSLAGGLVPLANTTMSAPGMGSNFSDLTSGLVMNSTGGTAFLGGYAANTSYAIFSGTPGSLQALVATGDPVPNVPGGTFLPGSYLSINDSSDVAFGCRIAVPGQANRFALYSIRQGTITAIATQGDPAPGAGPAATFFVVSPIAILSDGSVLFSASLQNNNCATPPCSTSAMYFWKQGVTTPVAMNRNFPYPEQPANFDVDHIETVAMNDAGQLVFQVNFYYGQTYTAVYGWTEADGLFPIAVPGSQFEVAPGEYKTVLSASLEPAGGSISSLGYTPSTNLSQLGRVLLRILFTDFAKGYYTGQFAEIHSFYFPPGTAFCAGDGTLATACPCANTGAAGNGCANSGNAAGAHLDAAGGASISEDGLLLSASGELPTALSIVLQGSTQSTSGLSFGDGVRCTTGALKRIGSGNAVSGAFHYPGVGAPSISQRSAQLGDPLNAGMTRYYQVYYRDPSPSFCPSPQGATFNVTNGQVVTWSP